MVKSIMLLEGSIFVAGSVPFNGYVMECDMFSDSAESEDYARNSSNNDEVYVVPAFTGLGAPYWDSDADRICIWINTRDN